MKRSCMFLFTVIVAAATFAQDAQDLDRRLKAVEEKVRQLQQTGDVAELRREIDVLTREIEALKTSPERKVVEATGPQYGLGAAASKVYRAEPGVSIGGYGEFLYQKPQRGNALADVVRAVVYTGYKFNSRTLFNSELEVEHASTEFEGDESRDAAGGAVSVEFAYLDYLMRPSANARVGLVLMPMGLVNEQHEPTAYFGTHRPEVEERILPTTWSEIGAGVFGDAGTVSYRGYIVTGLNSRRFSAEEGVHEGKQSGASAAADDLALTGRVDWHPVEGTTIGASAYVGDSGQGASYRGRVTLADVHADSKFRGLSLRGLVARGRIGDAAAISAQNGETIGSSLGGWYVEGAWGLSSILRRTDVSFSPYLRYERLNTQRRVPAGFERDSENDRRITTLGIAFKPIPQSVIKTDWQKIRTGSGESNNRFNIGVGYIF
jgi:hypothetical protein